MRSRVAFLVERHTPDFEAVYAHETRERLAKTCGVPRVPVIEAADLPKRAHELAAVEHIFSTWYMPRLGEQEIARFLPRLKEVYYAAGSVKYFSEPFFKLGIKLYSAAPINARPVSDYTYAQIVLACKGYFTARVSAFRSFHGAARKARRFAGSYQPTVGILGLGEIGRQVATMLLRGLDAEVLAYDPYVSREAFEELGCRESALEEIFSSCDVISNHMADVPATKSLLDGHLFSMMKPTATFINTGRGEQVVERDLAKTLRKNRNQTALLDVTSPAVVRPWSPLLRVPNIHITPHIAGSMGHERSRLGDAMVDAFLGGIHSAPVNFEVQPDDLMRRA